MMNNFFQKNRGQILPLALVLLLGAGLGSASIEVSKRAGLGPFHFDNAANEISAHSVAHATATPVLRLAALRANAVPSCSCGVQTAHRPLFRPGRLAANLAPTRAAHKPAGDCMQASNVDAQDPVVELADVSVFHEVRKMPGDVNADQMVADAGVFAAYNAGAGNAPAAGIAAPLIFDNPLFADPMIAASFGGGSGFVGGDGPIASMAANESFGAPILFAATSNPGTGGSNAAAVVGDTPPTVPEPAPLALFALGMLCLAASRGRALARLTR